MKTLEIYRNYGVLGAEKRNVFTYGGEHPTADCSDTLTVAVPDDRDLHETANGQTVVTAPWGWEYDINEVLQGNKNPYFYAMDKEMTGHRVELQIIAE